MIIIIIVIQDFNLCYQVDLAGSENIGRSGAVDKRAREAGKFWKTRSSL